MLGTLEDGSPVVLVSQGASEPTLALYAPATREWIAINTSQFARGTVTPCVTHGVLRLLPFGPERDDRQHGLIEIFSLRDNLWVSDTADVPPNAISSRFLCDNGSAAFFTTGNKGTLTSFMVRDDKTWRAVKMPPIASPFGLSIAAIGSSSVLIQQPGDSGRGSGYVLSENGDWSVLSVAAGPVSTSGGSLFIVGESGIEVFTLG
jgi:hypothetical protein